MTPTLSSEKGLCFRSIAWEAPVPPTTKDSASGMLHAGKRTHGTLYFKSCSWNLRRQRIQNLALYNYIYHIGDT